MSDTTPEKMEGGIRVKSPTHQCPYCKDQIGEECEQYVCKRCLARHHPECWQELNRCSVHACGSEGYFTEGTSTALVKGSPATPDIAAKTGAVEVATLTPKDRVQLEQHRADSNKNTLKLGGALAFMLAVASGVFYTVWGEVGSIFGSETWIGLTFLALILLVPIVAFLIIGARERKHARRSVESDLDQGQKAIISEHLSAKREVVDQRKNVSYLLMAGDNSYQVRKQTFDRFEVGERVRVHRAPKTGIILDIEAD